MSYITLAELKKALGQKETIFTSIMSDEELTAIIIEREKFIDEYIGPSVKLPFEEDSIPKMIKYICTNLCVYDIYAENANTDVPEVVKDDKKEAMTLLDKILNKKIPLGSQGDDTEDDGLNDIKFDAKSQFLKYDL